VTAIVRAGAAGAGAEFGLVEQGVEGAGEGLFGGRLAAQGGLGFGGAEGDRSARADGDVDIGDGVVRARQSDGAIQDGERHSLRAHDAFEAGGGN